MKRRRGGRGRGGHPKRLVRAPRPHPAERDPNPAPPLPPGTVILVCGETGHVISDVLEWDRSLPGAETAEVEGWYPSGDRYAHHGIDGVT